MYNSCTSQVLITVPNAGVPLPSQSGQTQGCRVQGLRSQPKKIPVAMVRIIPISGSILLSIPILESTKLFVKRIQEILRFNVWVVLTW